MGYYSSIIEWNIFFQSKNKYVQFLEDIENLVEVVTYPQERTTIQKYCPIGKDYDTDEMNFTVHTIKNNGDIDFFQENEDILEIELIDLKKDELIKEGQMELYGRELWIPFIAKYLIGSFKVKAENNKLWGVYLFGDGTFNYINNADLVNNVDIDIEGLKEEYLNKSEDNEMNKIIKYKSDEIIEPCKLCGFCPYGNLVKKYPFLQKHGKDYCCKTFEGCECPVYYQAEGFAEENDLSERMIDNFSNTSLKLRRMKNNSV